MMIVCHNGDYVMIMIIAIADINDDPLKDSHTQCTWGIILPHITH